MVRFSLRAISTTIFWRPCCVLESGTSGSGPSSGNGEVEADDIRQRGNAKLGVDQRLQPVEFFLRFIPGPPHHRHTPGMILSESGERPHRATRAFRSA